MLHLKLEHLSKTGKRFPGNETFYFYYVQK